MPEFFDLFFGRPGVASVIVAVVKTVFRNGFPWASVGRHGLPASYPFLPPQAATAATGAG